MRANDNRAEPPRPVFKRSLKARIALAAIKYPVMREYVRAAPITGGFEAVLNAAGVGWLDRDNVTRVGRGTCVVGAARGGIREAAREAQKAAGVERHGWAAMAGGMRRARRDVADGASPMRARHTPSIVNIK